MLRKKVSILGVFTLSLWFGWPQEIGRPGVGGDTPSHGQPGVVGPGAPAVVPSVYDDATACWSFNDPTDLGNDDCTDTYDLTAVNTPTATGGALGYAMKVASASTQFATLGGANPLPASATSFTAVTWISPVDVAGVEVWFSSTVAGAANGWQFYSNGTALIGGACGQEVVSGATMTAGGRHMLAVATDTSTALVSGDGENWAASAGCTNDAYDAANGFTIGAQTFAGANPADGVIGPTFFYSDDVSNAVLTSLYNSGKGMTCEAAEAAGLKGANGVSCWNMTENGGPYVDSWGSNDLTGVNTPTQAAGLVEQSESGMGMYTVATSSQYLNLTNPSWSVSSGFAINFWTNPVTGQAAAAEDNGAAERSWQINNAGQFYYFEDDGTFQLVTCAPTANVWSMATYWWDPSDKKGKCSLNAAAATEGTALTNPLQTQAADFTYAKGGGHNTGSHDMVGLWIGATPGSGMPSLAELYAGGVGVFYAAYLDFIFDGPRFAWSDRPEPRRIYVR